MKIKYYPRKNAFCTVRTNWSSSGKPSIIFVKNFASLVVEKKTEAEKEEDSIKIVNEIQSSEEPMDYSQ